jgi:hypothetical protein
VVRWILVAIGAFALGGFLGGVVANATIPSREQMRTQAAELVPPGRTLLTGLEILVGPYQAFAGFQTYGIEVEVVSDAMLDHGARLGWRHVDTEVLPGGYVQRWTRQEADASLHIKNAEMSEEGTVYVRYPDSPSTGSSSAPSSEQPSDWSRH